MSRGGTRVWKAAIGSFALLLAGSSSAGAALYELRGGTPVLLPVGFTSSDHQVLRATVTDLTLGYVGGSLVTLVPDLILMFTYLGSESKDRNFLLVSSEIRFAEEQPSYSGTHVTPPVPIGTFVQPWAGTIDLGFANGASVSPKIWRNAYPEQPATNVSVWFAGLGNSTVLFGLNDRGPDQDWDDFVGRIDLAAVPLPGAAWLLGAALICLAGVAQARRNSARATDTRYQGSAVK
jgi:hypothetical protein